MDSNFVNMVTAELFVGDPYSGNPHLKYIEPYKTLYNRDKSKDKKKACNEFYAVYIMSSPDEDTNKWIKLSEEKRKEVVAAQFKIDWEDKIIKECINDYPSKCMSFAEVTLKAIRDKLDERDKFLKNSPYTTDIYARDKEGNYISKGNTFLVDKLSPDKIDSMIKTTAALYKELSEAEALFKIEKENLQIRGGRRPTDTETGELYKDVDFD